MTMVMICDICNKTVKDQTYSRVEIVYPRETRIYSNRIYSHVCPNCAAAIKEEIKRITAKAERREE